MTHTQFLGLDDIQRLITNCDIAQCDFRIAKDLKHASRVLRCGRARVVITVRVSERRFIIKMLGPHY